MEQISRTQPTFLEGVLRDTVLQLPNNQIASIAGDIADVAQRPELIRNKDFRRDLELKGWSLGMSLVPMGAAMGERAALSAAEKSLLPVGAAEWGPGDLVRSAGQPAAGLPADLFKSRCVYRGLAKGEDAAAGLSARAPGAGNSVASHIAGKRASQWISTTLDEGVARGRFGDYGVVKIDLSKVDSEIVDVSRGIPGMEGTMLSNWAAKMKEVLIKDYIPPEAIN